MVNIPPERRFEISRKADQFIQNLPEKLRLRIKEAIGYLIAGNVNHLNIKALTNHPHEYRLRVGRIRILFHADKDLLFIYKAGFRGDVYRK